MRVETKPRKGPNWLRWAVGEEHFVEAIKVSPNQPGRVSGATISDEVLELCAQLVSLTELNLSNTDITDAGLRNIRDLVMLQELYLEQTEISDDGIEQIAKLTNLRRLSLKHTEVTDLGLARLASLQKLQAFSLASPNVKGWGLRFLRNCGDLKELQFVGPSATTKWVKAAGPPPNIQWLEFHRTNIDDEGIALLANCPNITSAYLNHNCFTDDALQYLNKHQLSSFEIRGVKSSQRVGSQE